MIKHGFSLLLLVFFTLTLSAQKQVIDKVVGTVGGELILLSEIEEKYALAQSQQSDLPADARCRILDQVMSDKLLINQARLDSVEVSPSDVEDQLNARIEQILAYMNNDVSQFESYYGQTINEVKDQFREDLMNQMLQQRMQAGILNSVNVTPSETKAFFSSIPVDSLPYFNSEVEIGEIVLKVMPNEEEKDKTRAKLEEIREAIITEQATFEQMAQQYSEDGTARMGGDLGWATRGKFVPEFEATAYKLKDGEISQITETPFGFHLIQMLERRGNSIHTRHILIRPEITDSDIEYTAEKLDSIRQLVLDSMYSFSLAVKYFGYDEVQSFNNDGRMVNPSTGNTFWEVGDLDPDVYFAVDTLNVGEISASVEYRDQMGETFFHILKMDSRSAPHKANLAQDYSKIQQAAIESKKNTYIQDWVKEKISATYIFVDPMFEGCEVLQKWINPEDTRP